MAAFLSRPEGGRVNLEPIDQPIVRVQKPIDERKLKSLYQIAIQDTAQTTRKPVIYLAGPYSHPDPVENTHRAIEIANGLLDICSPFIPHLTLLWHLVSPKPYPEWLAIDLDHVAVCDAVYRFPGESSGADGEVNYALSIAKPVFHSEGALREWAREWKP
jgi:hypothetical protein